MPMSVEGNRLMRRSRTPQVLLTLALASSAAVAAWGFWIDPDRPWRWLLLGGVLPVLWAYVKRAQVRGDDPEVGAALMVFHRYVLAFAGFMLTSRVGIRLAVHEGLLDPTWLSTGRRLGALMMGVGMILFGNFLPTLRSPWSLAKQPFEWQQVHRFAGWTLVLGGLGVIASWTFLPLASADRASVLIVVLACLCTVGRKLASLTTRSLGPR